MSFLYCDLVVSKVASLEALSVVCQIVEVACFEEDASTASTTSPRNSLLETGIFNVAEHGPARMTVGDPICKKSSDALNVFVGRPFSSLSGISELSVFVYVIVGFHSTESSAPLYMGLTLKKSLSPAVTSNVVLCDADLEGRVTSSFHKGVSFSLCMLTFTPSGEPFKLFQIASSVKSDT